MGSSRFGGNGPTRSFYHLVALGKIPGMSIFTFSGENTNIGLTGNPKTIADVCELSGQSLKIFSTTAAINTISSSSALDVGYVIPVIGLDGNWQMSSQYVVLNGQNKVTLNPPLVRTWKLTNYGIGIGPGNLNGTVYCYEDTAISGGVPTDKTKVRAMIVPGRENSFDSTISIPIDKIASSWNSTFALSGIGNANVKIETRFGNGPLQLPLARSAVATITSAGVPIFPEESIFPITVPAPFDIVWNAIDCSANGVAVYATTTVLYEDF